MDKQFLNIVILALFVLIINVIYNKYTKVENFGFGKNPIIGKSLLNSLV